MEHSATAACAGVHCYYHQEDEPTESSLAIICHECYHTFEDPVALVEADNAKRDECGMGPRPEAHAQAIGDAIKGDRYAVLDLITSCPFCAHSF